MTNIPFTVVKDEHGAQASIFIEADNEHRVYYEDNVGHQFFREDFPNTSIEIIEQSVLDWAEGRRILA
jgi:hypothetical protein